MFAARFIARSLLVALALWATAASAAPTEETFDVLLKDGTRYQDVTYRVRSEFSVLEIKDGDTVANVSFSDVLAIYDADGTDIAEDILGKGYRPVTEPVAPPEPEPEAEAEVTVPPTPEKAMAMERDARLPRRHDDWSVVLAAEGRMDHPFEEYYEGTDGGPGFGGTIHVRLTRDLAFRGSITRLGIKFGDDFGLVSYDPMLQIVSQDYSLTGIRYLAGVEYHKAFRNAPWGFWYLQSSVGEIQHKLEGHAVLYDQLAGQTIQVDDDDTDTHFAMEHGAGVIYGLSEGVGLAGTVNLDLVWVDTRGFLGHSSSVRGLILGGSVGLAVRL